MIKYSGRAVARHAIYPFSTQLFKKYAIIFSMKKFKRVLLKLSGEQFSGKKDFGIDADFLVSLSKELCDVIKETEVQLVVVVGGGNFLRGSTFSKNTMIERATADYMGMLATIINGMALVDTIEYLGQPARLQTRLRVESVAEPFIRRKAIRHLEKGRIVVVGGGTGSPYFTTDTTAILTALELNCEIVLKATKVDGVYSKDPLKYSDAVKMENTSYIDAIKNKDISIMDNAAVSHAMEHNLPIRVFDLLTPGNIKKVVNGEALGTLISG